MQDTMLASTLKEEWLSLRVINTGGERGKCLSLGAGTASPPHRMVYFCRGLFLLARKVLSVPLTGLEKKIRMHRPRMESSVGIG